MKKLIIPSRFSSVNYDNDVLPDIKKAVERFQVAKKGLYLYGAAGTGKTHTAYAICKKFQEEGFKVQAFKAVDVLKMAREDMNIENRRSFKHGDKFFEGNSFSNQSVDFLDGLLNYNGLLFIDDLGTEKSTEWALETFYAIIDKKYEDMIPVIFTSNNNLDELSIKMGDRISSRIAQMCDIFEMKGEDRRLQL